MPSATPDLSPSVEALDSAQAGGRFIRGSIVRVLTYGVSVLTSIVSAPLVIRHLGPTSYGYFATVTAIVFIVGGFTEGGLNMLGVREFATGRPDRVELLRNLVGLRVTASASVLAIVAIVCAVAGAPQVIVLGVLLSGSGLIVTITGENYGIPLSADLRLTAVSLLGLAQQFALATTYIVLVVIGARTLPLLGSTIVSGIVLLAGTAFLIRGQASVVPAFDLRVWAGLLRQTLPYAMATAVGIIYFREALVLMSILTNAREVGYYGAAFKIVEVLAAIPWTLISGAFPIFSRAAHIEDDARLRYGMQRLVDTALIAGVWMVGSIVLGAAFGIAVVAGHGFDASIPVLRIQGFAVLTSFMASVFGSVLLSLRMFGVLLRANALCLAVTTVVALALIPPLGARGAAIAPTAAEVCLAVAYAWSLGRARPTLRVTWTLVPRVALAAVVAFGIAFALPISSAVSIVVFGALYFAALIVLRAIPMEIVNAVLRREPEPTPPAGADQPPERT